MNVDFEPYRRVLNVADEWTSEVQRRLGTPDRHHAWLALGAVLQALRDQLTVAEAADLGAQLPLLVRGVYFTGWSPGAKKTARTRTLEPFLERIRRRFPKEPDLDAAATARAVFAVVDAHVTPGETRDVRQTLPKAIRDLWPAAAAVTPKAATPEAAAPAVETPERTTRPVERKEWGNYLAALSNRMRDRTADLRVESPVAGEQHVAKLPLIGISTTGHGEDARSIEVTLGGTEGVGSSVTHVVEHPTRVQVLGNGEVACLEIEDEDDVKTLLLF